MDVPRLCFVLGFAFTPDQVNQRSGFSFKDFLSGAFAKNFSPWNLFYITFPYSFSLQLLSMAFIYGFFIALLSVDLFLSDYFAFAIASEHLLSEYLGSQHLVCQLFMIISLSAAWDDFSIGFIPIILSPVGFSPRTLFNMTLVIGPQSFSIESPGVFAQLP